MGNQNNQYPNRPSNNQNRQPVGKADLLARSVNCEPVGVMYNVTGSMVEDYVIQYLTNQGVDGIANVKVHLKNDRGLTSVAVYLFISKHSKGVISNERDIPEMLRSKVDKVDLKLSDDLKRILVPLAGQEFQAGKAERGEYYVKLNIFYILGLMFSAVQGVHQLTIPTATAIPGSKDCVISLIKQERYQRGGNNGNNDNYSRQVENLERHCR